MTKNKVLFTAAVSLQMTKASIACQMCFKCESAIDKAMCRLDCIDALSSAFDAFKETDQAEDDEAIANCGSYLLDVSDICSGCSMDAPSVKNYIDERTKKVRMPEKPKKRGKVISIDKKY